MSAEIRRLLSLITDWANDDAQGYDDAMVILGEIERTLQALLPPAGSPPVESHRCSGCGHRWEGPLKGAELCGDCWRKGQATIFGSPPVEALVPQWREEAERLATAPPFEFNPKRAKALWWCADQLEAALKGVPLVMKDEDLARVEPGATMPSARSTAKSATGDKSPQ